MASNGKVLFIEQFGWIAASDWKHRGGEPYPDRHRVSRAVFAPAAVRAQKHPGFSWTEVFVSKEAALVDAAAAAGLAVALMARRYAPGSNNDVGSSL